MVFDVARVSELVDDVAEKPLTFAKTLKFKMWFARHKFSLQRYFSKIDLDEGLAAPSGRF